MRHMGHMATALVACKIGYVGWHMVPWILETTNLQSFLNKGKGLVYGLPAWRSAHEKSPWVSSSATCAFSTFHSLPSPTSSSSPSPPSPLILEADISVGPTVINDASANPSRGKRPSPWQRPARDLQAALDNGTDHISMRKTKGSWFFFFFLAPERLEELLLYQIMLHSKAWKRNKPSSICKPVLEMLS